MNGINTFIFDMGNVLIDYNPFRIMEEIVGDWEAIPEIMAATVFSPLWIEQRRRFPGGCSKNYGAPGASASGEDSSCNGAVG